MGSPLCRERVLRRTEVMEIIPNDICHFWQLSFQRSGLVIRDAMCTHPRPPPIHQFSSCRKNNGMEKNQTDELVLGLGLRWLIWLFHGSYGYVRQTHDSLTCLVIQTA